MRVGLVGCVKTKLDHPAPARDLYGSALFRGRRRYVESSCHCWFVLSTRYSVVSPDEETLRGKSTHAKRLWARSVVAGDIVRELDQTGIGYGDTVFELHVGDGKHSRPSRMGSDVLRLSQTYRGSYAPLAAHLKPVIAAVVQMPFSEVERILGRGLPPSARRHRAWWANSGTHGQAAAWMGVGWLVDVVDLSAGTVRFRRGRQ